MYLTYPLLILSANRYSTEQIIQNQVCKMDFLYLKKKQYIGYSEKTIKEMLSEYGSHLPLRIDCRIIS